MAITFTERIRGERADNLEQAIEHYTLALEVYTPQAFPAQWAQTHCDLSGAYAQRIHGEQVDNLEQAIEHATLALEVFDPEAHPESWAGSQNNLATAYVQRIHGERADNLEQAIEHYILALEVFDPQADPKVWAGIQGNLARAYADRVCGERAGNLERAIEHYTLALKVYMPQALPAEWAAAQSNLATAYAQRIRGERADNVERAMEHYTLALEVYTREVFPTEWAQMQNNLANAYANRIRGERAENLERAIELYTLALEVRTRQAFPADWAMTHHNLASAYAQRIRGARADNLEQAIEHFALALEVHNRQASPAKWAGTHVSLATSYTNRIRGERAENLERAIELYTLALEVYTRQAFPAEWAQTQNNLATAYVQRIHGERADNLERAIEHYTLALEVRTRQAFPTDWAMTQNNLGLAYTDRIHGERAENLERAIEHYTQALEVYTLEQLPADHLRTMRNLANLHFDMQNWQEAYEAYEAAVEAGDLLLGAAYTESGRRAEVAETTRLHARAAYASLKTQRRVEALLTLEQGKTRLLSEALALAEADLEEVPEAQQRDLREARRGVRELEAEMRLPPGTPARRNDRELADLLQQARADLGDLIEAIRQAHPDFMPTGLDLPGILALIPGGGALVAPLLTSQGSAVFVLPEGTRSVEARHVIPLEGFTAGDLLELFLGPEEETQPEGWIGAYAASRDGRTGASFEAWRAAIEAVTHRLWEALLAPIHDRLQALGLAQDAPVILMPQGGLGLLPLHAAWREVDGAKRAFLDDYTVTYAPSAYALSVAQRRLGEPQRHGASLLAVVNPTGDLHHAPGEGVAVAAHFEPWAQSVLMGAEATQEAVMAQALGRCYLHFACHGFYHWQDPMASGLLLAGSDPTTPTNPFELREILSPRFDLSAARLVTLSACETGLTDIVKSPDEYIGLPSGFLEAGAPAVVSSLWAVNDLSTALLMGESYRRHLEEGEGIAEALRDAQLWLRDLDRDTALHLVEPLWDEAQQEDPALFGAIDSLYWALLQGGDEYEHPFAHPYYWGAFTASGAV